MEKTALPSSRQSAVGRGFWKHLLILATSHTHTILTQKIDQLIVATILRKYHISTYIHAYMPKARVTNEAVDTSTQPDRSKSNRFATSIAQWLFALFIFSTLTWVALWTILAAHTDIARDKIYPALESKYFEDKAGARIFIYFGLFYLLAGAVILLFLALGINLPKPGIGLVKLYKLPWTGEYWTMMELLALAIFVLVQVTTIAVRADLKFKSEWTAYTTWYQVCKTLGKTCAITLTVLFLPICKNSCFWLDVFNVQFERSVKYHRWLGWFLVLAVCIHAATAITSLVLRGEFNACMWPSENGCNVSRHKESIEVSRTIAYGWISAVVALPMVITSLPWFRRRKFELFYYSHLIFGLVSLLLVHLHWKDLIYYTAPSLAAYSLDKVICRCCTLRKVKMVDLSIPAPGFVRMKIAVESDHIFQPGQWVNINIPAISFLQWHPMSIASAPGDSTIAIDVKVVGDKTSWSHGLEKLALRFDPKVPAHTCVRLDKYHGSSHTHMHGYLNHEAVLMVAGGIGITPLLSALRSAGKMSHIRRLVLVWVVKRKSVVDLYRAELAKVQALYGTAGGTITALVYATLSEAEEPAMTSVSLQIKDEQNLQNQYKESKLHSQGPFMQHVMGYGHKLFVTVGSGSGFLLGIFIANYVAYDMDGWRSEYQTLLQLCLALSFSATMSVIGMSGSIFRKAPKLTPDQEGKHTGGKSQSRDAITTDNAPQLVLKPDELQVILGCRPNINEIVDSMSVSCAENGCASVGVAVCGPSRLTDAVVAACKSKSISDIPFVIDSENFDW